MALVFFKKTGSDLEITSIEDAKKVGKMGYAGQIQPIEEVVIFEGDFYIAFNIQTDDALVAKWQTALDELIRDGTVDAIKKDY